MAAGSTAWPALVRDDLAPLPGRAAKSLRIALASVLTLVVLVTFRLPYISLGLYFVFLANRATPALSLRSSLYMFVSVVLALVAQLGVIALTENDPLARVLSLAVVVFIGAIFIHQSSIPTLGSTLGFIYAQLVAQWDIEGRANAIVESTLWILPTMSVGLGASILVEYVLARQNPTALLEAERARRYGALERMFTVFAAPQGDPEARAAAVLAVRQLAAAGQGEMQALYTMIASRHLGTGALPPAMQLRIAMLTRLMDLAAALGPGSLPSYPDSLAERYLHLAAFCRDQRTGVVTSEPVFAATGGPEALLRVERSAGEITRMPATAKPRRELVYEAPHHVPVLAARAFENKDALAFAAKLSLCATFCYAFYRATAWPGISTCVTTVLVTGLNDTGSIKQKLTLRLAGVAIGGILGLGCVALLIPRFDNIEALVVIIGTVSFALGWWSGGRQFGYLGTQLAYAFYGVALTGSRPATALAPARDNLFGVALATVVMWVVFDQLWPVTTRSLMRRTLASVLRKLSALLRLRGAPRSSAVKLVEGRMLRFEVGTSIASLRASSELTHYDFGPHHAHDVVEAGRIVSAAFDAGAMFFEELATLYEPEPVPRPDHRVMAERLEALAIAVEQDVPREQALQAAPEDAGAPPGFARVRESVLRLLRPA